MSKWKLVALMACSGAWGSQDAPGLASRDVTPLRLAPAEALKKTVDLPRGYAVVIGISSYRGLPDASLPFAEKDAENIYSVLISKEGGNIPFDGVVKLIGREATLERITETLERWLPERAKEGDRVIVFFVGHGVVDSSGRGYLAPWDVDRDRIAQTGYPMERLGRVLSQEVKSRWKVLLTDACHSGRISVSTDAAQVNERLRELPQSFVTLTSSRAAQRSFEDAGLAGGNGVFSYFLARGWLGEADVDPADGVVTADELIAFVKREVPAHVRRVGKGERQNPIEFGDFPDDMILGYNPSRRQKLARSVDEPVTGAVVVETNLDGVDVSVDGNRYGSVGTKSPLSIPGLSAGVHVIRGDRAGYEPVTREVNVVPGRTETVKLAFLRQRTVPAAALKEYEEAESIWRRSKASPEDLKRAAAGFARALKADPKLAVAMLGLCRVEQAQGKTEDAKNHCAEAVSLEQSFVEARMSLAILLMEMGDYDAAVRHLSRCTQQEPSNAFAQSLLAEALFLNDRVEQAEAAADRAIAISAGSAQGFLLRAEARRAQSKFDEAERDYRELLRLQQYDSSAVRVVAFWAIGHGMRKHRSGRRTVFRSQAASAYFGLCACEIGREDFRQATRYCARALEFEAGDPDTHLLLAEAWAGMFSVNNRRDFLLRAKENIQAALRLNPNIANAGDLRSKIREVDTLLTKVQ